ncbi:diguanylate cyclase [Methylorubrum populi BJ001]|jgi:diguanylate cyclase (GGDEF)-like protein|uniref:diguanylate cyclase n=1 Tax=Methylorubrum populi (strain ATCC BAA-705 / NCIMB 13946 / BJ001) TaxID=441620 RepID=B1ZA72_METPB|nr:diguanylate cyclase [Methylorubrum populi]ACB80582.1 diguanylate cyclase [Methylorubrum populi BJ001]OAH33341.1 dethiobiotin synthetase [Methylorubrum populi]PZP66550.1 MAG: GGDEF domain-containing protein [Methylorubrum populi]
MRSSDGEKNRVDGTSSVALRRGPARHLRAARSWIALGVLAPLGMLALSAVMLFDLRRDAWEKAEQTSKNLLQVIERDIARNVEIIDLSLQGIVDTLKMPGLADMDPRLRQLALFDRATTARDMGVMLVVDENGDTIFDAKTVPARRVNNADREYFQLHKARPDHGLQISPPLISRLLGEPVTVLSRRIDKPDGSFGGVVQASLKLAYFSALFDRIGLGQDGAINLYLRDGTRLMRYPAVEADIGANIAGAPTFQRFLAERSGSFTGTSVRDGIERYYAFTQVGDLPLVLNVALGTREIEAEWQSKAVGIGLAILVLCGLTILLSLLFGRELRRSADMQAELARLAGTDLLTGLPNRRRFEEAFEQAAKASRRADRPLALLVIDADHFKRYNDRHGHAVGDAVLKSLAKSLTESLRRPNDLAARVGGEEFAVLLPDTDRAGAARIAEAIHAAVAGLAVPAAGIDPGSITVSIGLAVSAGDRATEDLYRRADAALYVAKESGRNRTCCAPGAAEEAPERPPTRLTAAPQRRVAR